MDSSASGFLLNSVYYQSKEDDGIIDLGLSLRTLQPEAYHQSGGHRKFTGEEFKQKIQGIIQEDGGADDEVEGIQSKERWAYVKVNMDGVLVGRKICTLDHCGYTSLVCQLEDMLERNFASGLRLFQAGSEFSLFYKDRDENPRTVGDVPWKVCKICEEAEDCKKLKLFFMIHQVLQDFTLLSLSKCGIRMVVRKHYHCYMFHTLMSMLISK